MSVGEEEHKKDALPCGVVTKTSGNILLLAKRQEIMGTMMTRVVILPQV